jgi:hypothetical protein
MEKMFQYSDKKNYMYLYLLETYYQLQNALTKMENNLKLTTRTYLNILGTQIKFKQELMHGSGILMQ